MLWVDVTASEAIAMAWADGVRASVGASNTPRICVAMATSAADACRDDRGLCRRQWLDFAGPLDGRVLVERHGRRFENGRAHIAFKSALVAELAGADLALAARLVEEPLGRILATGRYPVEHIWAAQVSILLPIVERERRRLIEFYRDSWRLPHRRRDETEIAHADDLEIGDMAVQSQWVGALRSERRRLDWLRRVRNALAHNESVPWDTLITPVARGIVDFRQ